VQNAAEMARALIQRRFPSLRHLEASQILTMLCADDPTLYVGGEPVDVGEEIGAALQDTASAILAQVLPRWERTLAQGEVLLFGGGVLGAWLVFFGMRHKTRHASFWLVQSVCSVLHLGALGLVLMR
jgi:hypothetical protein